MRPIVAVLLLTLTTTLAAGPVTGATDAIPKRARAMDSEFFATTASTVTTPCVSCQTS